MNCKLKKNKKKPKCGGEFKGADTGEATLWIDNSQSLYRRKQALFNNYCGKLSKGKFNRNLAKKGFRGLLNEANRDYKKEFGDSLPLGDRRVSENILLKEFKTYVKIDAKQDNNKCSKLTKEQIKRLK